MTLLHEQECGAPCAFCAKTSEEWCCSALGIGCKLDKHRCPDCTLQEVKKLAAGGALRFADASNNTRLAPWVNRIFNAARAAAGMRPGMWTADNTTLRQALGLITYEKSPETVALVREAIATLLQGVLYSDDDLVWVVAERLKAREAQALT